MMPLRKFWILVTGLVYITVAFSVLNYAVTYRKGFQSVSPTKAPERTKFEISYRREKEAISATKREPSVDENTPPWRTKTIWKPTTVEKVQIPSSTVRLKTTKIPTPPPLLPVQNETTKSENETTNDDRKFAYIFYATNRDYFCHAVVNADLMINQYEMRKDVVIVILVLKHLESIVHKNYCISDCYGDRVKVVGIEPPSDLTTNTYYKHCYVKLLSFSLYKEYKRIVFLDSDGLVLQNMDHLFDYDLGEFKIGASHAYWIGKWLTTVFFVADLSEELNTQVAQYLEPKNLEKINKWAKRNAFDMEVINYVFDEGKKLKLMPFNYARLDDYFKEPSHASDWNNTYYIHFSHRKPFYYRQSKLWSKEPKKAPYDAPAFIRLFEIFWNGADKLCK